MKNRLCLLLLCLATSNLFGYKFKVKNQSPGRVLGRVKMIGHDGDLNFILDEGDDKEFESGGICASDVQVMGISIQSLQKLLKKIGINILPGKHAKIVHFTFATKIINGLIPIISKTHCPAALKMLINQNTLLCLVQVNWL